MTTRYEARFKRLASTPEFLDVEAQLLGVMAELHPPAPEPEVDPNKLNEVLLDLFNTMYSMVNDTMFHVFRVRDRIIVYFNLDRDSAGELIDAWDAYLDHGCEEGVEVLDDFSEQLYSMMARAGGWETPDTEPHDQADELE